MNGSDENLYTAFYVEEREKYTVFDSNGKASEFISGVLSTSETNYCLHAAIAPTRKDVNSIIGYAITPTNLGKWLTVFEHLKHWRGYQFDLSVWLGIELYDPLFGSTLGTRIVQYDKAGTEIKTETTFEQALTNEQKLVGVYRVALSEYDFEADCASYDVVLTIDGDLVTEVATVELKAACKGTYLRWLNCLGAFDGHLFVRGDAELSVSDAITMQRDVDTVLQTWDRLESEVEIVQKQSETENTITAFTTEPEAMKWVLRSPVVYRVSPSFVPIQGINDIKDGVGVSVFPICDKEYQQIQVLISTDSATIRQARGNNYEFTLTFVDSIRQRNQRQ
jgi:hypothetical protein